MATVLKYLLGTQTTLASTSLNSMASTALVVCAAFDNTVGAAGDGYTMCDVELVITFGTNPSGGTSFSLWFLTSQDGTNYEDGGTSLTPTRPPDVSFPVEVTTSGQRLIRRAQLPWGKLSPLLKNDATGQALAASGNTLKIRPVTTEGV